jgi:very-short-patch-repair endonuclease
MARNRGQGPPTTQEKQEIAARYAAGEGMDALGAEYHRDKSTLRKALAEAGITPRPRGNPKGTEWSPERREAHKRGCSTPEFVEKSRKALLQRLPGMRGPATNTPIEQRMQDALMKVGIGFTTQSLLLEKHLVDIEIHQAPIVIEADGSQHTLRIQKAKDAERDAALTAAGYRVFRFTGSEINADAAQCVQRVIDAAGLVPDEEPVYDIRTRFAGPLHPLWKGGAQEFTCAYPPCGVVFLAQPTHRKGPKAFCSRECAGKAKRGKPLTAEHRAAIGAAGKGISRACKPGCQCKRHTRYQIKRESALHGDMQKPAEMTGSVAPP